MALDLGQHSGLSSHLEARKNVKQTPGCLGTVTCQPAPFQPSCPFPGVVTQGTGPRDLSH